MPKNLAEMRSIVQDYIDDSTITPDQHIFDSVNHLSNVFSIKTIDTSQSTVDAELELAMPTLAITVTKVLIDGDVVKKLDSMDNLQYNIDNSLNKWYIADSKINFTQAHSGIKTTAIHHDKGFLVPAEAVDSDVPDRYLELVYIGASYRYFNKIVSKVILNRDTYPDVTPKEIKAIRDSWKDQYFDLIDEIKKDIKAL